MEVIKVSPKYQVVIPLRVRESLQLQPGQKLHVLLYKNRIELIPEKKISDMKGFLRGIDTHIERELNRL